ncbi:MAG: cytochrome c oxidase subunit I [Actinomycetota bacterium]|nr:cytochrome c oxidase subunit I [Actinomycetota bacterium]
MTTVLEPPVPAAPTTSDAEDTGLLRRPTQPQGVWSWITTVDHKRIGILYGVTAFMFFLAGGIEALLIRLQLAQPNGTVLGAQAYNEVFTMHGTTMVFLVVMPLSAAFFNFVMPLQIGARDVAFPRLNAFSYWAFLFGGLFLYSSFLLGGAPDGGWFGYAPNTSIVFSPGHGIDFWIYGLQILGIASTVSAVNFIVTMLNMRAPGMTLMRMPVFSWMTLISSFLILFAMPVITIDLFLLSFDRNFGANFFNPEAGGDPVLWQHLFWIFGHPEVYILILPAMGMVSEILPVFSRKPLFGYPVMVFSGIAIGFMGWGVWVHHMFAVGLGPVAVSAFSLSTMFIAVPTGVKIFNWIATTWKGSLKFSTPMLFAMGFVAMFTIGGLSGVTHAVSPHDRQQTDTYYVVAHFHYVLFGGALFGIMGGIYYWWPKVFGVMLNERLGKLNFWTWFVGFNLAFGPMHILGLQGMPRRIYTYDESLGLDLWNMVSTVGAFIIAFSVAVFMLNVRHSNKRERARASADPWDARTLEWSIPSPPPHYNFAEIPTVHALDEHWHRKYTEDDEGRPVRVDGASPADGHGDGDGGDADAEGNGDQRHADDHGDNGHGIHMPSPSYFPLVAAFGLPVMAYGMVYGRSSGQSYVVTALGALILLAGLFAWAMEPSAEPDEDGREGGEADAATSAPEPALVAAGSAEEPVGGGQHARELDEGSSPEAPADGEGSAPDQSGS